MSHSGGRFKWSANHFLLVSAVQSEIAQGGDGAVRSMRVRVSHGEKSDCSDSDFDTRHQHSVNELRSLGLKNNAISIFHSRSFGNMSLMV